MAWRAILLNRFSSTAAAILTVVLAWNVYVSMNNGGSLRGYVIDGIGEPLTGATVTLLRKTVLSVEPIDETITDASGAFAFENHGEYALVLTVSADGLTSPRTVLPLWFRNQDVVIDHPIIFDP